MYLQLRPSGQQEQRELQPQGRVADSCGRSLTFEKDTRQAEHQSRDLENEAMVRQVE